MEEFVFLLSVFLFFSFFLFSFFFVWLFIVLFFVLFLVRNVLCFFFVKDCFFICLIGVIKNYIKKKLIKKMNLVKVVILEKLFDCMVKWSSINGLMIKLRLENVLKFLKILG